MDFNKYYMDQAVGNSFPVFQGPLFQRGYGLGNVFKRFISWAIPLLKDYALPIAKNVGKEVINTAASVAQEAIEGKDIKESAKEKIKNTLQNLKQTGKGLKRKKSFSKPKPKRTKRELDIFD